VILAREARNEEGDCLVADELVHDPVPAVDGPRGRAPETRQKRAELARRQTLRQRGRAADVGEERRDLHLGPARMLVRGLDAPGAEPPVERRGLASHQADEKVARLSERRVTELAAWLGGDLLPERLDSPQTGNFPVQDPAPLFGRGGVAHRESRILRAFE